ncbi:hypothetical protein BTM305_08570 [Helicobacter pylori]
MLEKMAKESENKAFYKVFCESYEEFFNKIKQIKPIQSEQKKRAKCWLQPYITLSICLKKGFISCRMDDLNPTEAIANIAEQRNTEILKKLFNFDLTELQALIDFLR